MQESKSQFLTSKLANVRSMEQRCLVLDHKIALQNFKILALKAEIESLDVKYDEQSQKLMYSCWFRLFNLRVRVLKGDLIWFYGIF